MVSTAISSEFAFALTPSSGVASINSFGSASSKLPVFIQSALENTTGFTKLHRAEDSADSSSTITPRSTSTASVFSKLKNHLQSAKGLTESDAVVASKSSKCFEAPKPKSFDVEQNKILYS